MPSFIRGAAPDQPSGPPVYDVEAPSPGVSFDLTVLGEYVVGVDVHWIVDPATRQGHTERCYREEGDCPHCGKHRRYWLGFVAIYRHDVRKKVVLRMSKESVRALAVAVGRSGRIRGRRFWIDRAKASPTAALLWRHHQYEPLAPLPDAPCVKASVCQVLRCEDIPNYEYRPSEITEHPDADGL